VVVARHRSGTVGGSGLSELFDTTGIRPAVRFRTMGVEAQRRPVPRWRLVVATLAVVAVCLVGSVVVGSMTAGSGDETQTYNGTIDAGRLAGASAELEVGDGAVLVAERLPQPLPGEGYQAWLKRPGIDAPEPSVLFLPRDGAATVAVPADGDIEAVLVTREQRPGSNEPSESPVIEIPLLS
jgi:Anti-sigma-K factor rskA